MSEPYRFSWIDKPKLAAMAQPTEFAEFAWLRQQGIQLVVSLTEDAPRRDWINDAGLMLLHEPIEDMTAPTQEQLKQVLSTVKNAHEHDMGVVVHCAAGLGRTGVIVACYHVSHGLTADTAITRIRRQRPGSIETDEQAEAVYVYAKSRNTGERPSERD